MDAETRKQKRREYYYANRERIQAQHREYVATHEEALKQKRRESYAANKELTKAQAMEWKRTHREQTNSIQSNYVDKNRDEVNRKRRAYGALHREDLNTRQRAYNEANRERLRGYRLKKNYGLSLEEWDALYEKQGGRCAICKQSFEVIHKLKVDHCHNSTKVRGLLCSNCNSALGLFKDDINALQAAIEYLNNSKAP